MKKLTIVIRYEDDQQQPELYADMECLGGIVEGVMPDDALERLEEAQDYISEMTEQMSDYELEQLEEA